MLSEKTIFSKILFFRPRREEIQRGNINRLIIKQVKYLSFLYQHTENQAPVFNLSGNPLKVFKGQTWKYQVPVTDPESQRMEFKFVGEFPSGMEISSAGVITWFPQQVNKTYEVTLKATDSCGENASGKFIVETKHCLCEGNNGGYCVWESNVPKCKCPDDGCLEPT